MKFLLIAGSFVLALTGSTFAADDIAIGDDEVSKLNKVLEAWGCKDGVIEKEQNGMYEIDDAECSTGTYDFHIDPDFVATVIIRH